MKGAAASAAGRASWQVRATVQDKWAKKRAIWARENTAYLNKLLSESQPALLVTLRAAERLVDLELTDKTREWAVTDCHDQRDRAVSS